MCELRELICIVGYILEDSFCDFNDVPVGRIITDCSELESAGNRSFLLIYLSDLEPAFRGVVPHSIETVNPSAWRGVKLLLYGEFEVWIGVLRLH